VCKSHGQVHWLLVPCKRRDCDTCGPVGRHRIAQRIAHGVRELWPAGWLVLTFAQDIEKKEAVRCLAKFVKFLRTTPGNSGLQYVATYELTLGGRLHINLICAPWVYVAQADLQEKWGAIVWVEWVQDTTSLGKEAAKDYSPESLGGYLAKLEQCVPTDRRVSYSKGWPKMEKSGHMNGEIKWLPMTREDRDNLAHFLRKNMLLEVRPGEWVLDVNRQDVPVCDCFQLALPLEIPP